MSGFAQQAGVHSTVIYSWLSGSEPTRSKLATLADNLDVSLDWLISGRGPARRYVPIRHHPMDALLETVAIIAYRQPITRAEIEQLRGVDTGDVLETLLERRLVRIAGRKEASSGRPLMYATTSEFLEAFRLKDLQSLPDMDITLVESDIAFSRDWISGLPRSPAPESLFFVKMEGDAMEPTLRDRDLVLINSLDQRLRDGLLAIWTGDGPQQFILRRIQVRPDGGYRILCDNPAYPPGEATTLRTLGRIVWRGGRLI